MHLLSALEVISAYYKLPADHFITFICRRYDFKMNKLQLLTDYIKKSYRYNNSSFVGTLTQLVCIPL